MINFKTFFTESTKKRKFVILLPGGFKPPTLGHFHLIQSYNNHPDVERVIVLIGPNPRKGFTREESMKVFELYNVFRMPKVDIIQTPENSPMMAAFKFLQDIPSDIDINNVIFGVGSSDKGDDQIRSLKFVKSFKHNPSALPEGVKVGVPPTIASLTVDSQTDISATALRQAIVNKNLKQIKELIPPGINPQGFLDTFNNK